MAPVAPLTRFCFCLILTLMCIPAAQAEPRHGIAMYGDPALPPDFVSLSYVNPDAPKGGKVVMGEVGGFDSLNPHIRKGRVPWQLRYLAYESLMGRSWDEPFTLYGLLAESIEVSPEGDSVSFVLREEARFSDGSPVTVEDVLWSYETLGTKGHPRYAASWTKIEKAEQTGPRSVRFTFNVQDRELALIMGLRPILKKSQWEGRDFAESGIDEVPIATSAYVVDSFEAGRFVSLKRNPDYWGKDLPLRRGTHNFDEIRFEFFGDATAMFEAFKAGELNILRENNAARWDTQYNFGRAQDGTVVKSEIGHQRPSGIRGFVMNTRRAPFSDWRVREALIQAFNFEFINEKLNGGSQPRITSYFSNSSFAMSAGPAEGKVADLLAPFASELVPGTLEGYSLPVSDGSGRNRRGIRKATALLEEAGWSVKDGVLQKDGQAFRFEILLRQGSSENRAIINIYKQALERLGIFATVATVDGAQYKERSDLFDFDMTFYSRGLSLSPGNEQLLYWGRAGVEQPGSRNWMGMDSPAAEAMINTMLTVTDQKDYVAAVRALDRILTAGRYVIPIWYSKVSRIAHDRRLVFSDRLPAYGDWIGFLPDVWWYEE
ncbi:MAG: ABC transporter substrate-binding protein [Litoreibacter sp.]|nr:ABC transporter substrate-binding protein [Litoreibacter sp.]